MAVLGEISPKDLIALTDDSKTGSIDAGVISQVITNASGYIDSRVANIYGSQLPFNPIPSSVASMALTITCYRLFRRREIPDEKNKFTEAWIETKDFLDRVNKGEAMIDDAVSRDFAQVAFTSRSTTYGGSTSNWPANSL